MSVSANMEQDILRTLLSEEQLKQRVAELGAQITKEYGARTCCWSRCSRVPWYFWPT